MGRDREEERKREGTSYLFKGLDIHLNGLFLSFFFFSPFAVSCARLIVAADWMGMGGIAQLDRSGRRQKISPACKRVHVYPVQWL